MGRGGTLRPMWHAAVLLTSQGVRDYRELRVKRLGAMCSGIQLALAADGARASLAASNLAGARAIAERFPLVHRTVAPEEATLEDIFSDGRLLAKKACTQREIDCGVERAIYFFLGCAAYPRGAVAFLVPTRVLTSMRASYSPFDSGCLKEHAHLRSRGPLTSWGDSEKLAFLESHLGDGTDAVAFCAEYVAAHFADSADYVLRPQQSVPDFPPYHDLVSKNGDRRAWTIEVRLHEDLVLDVDHVEHIVIGRLDLFDDIPDALTRTVVVAGDDASIPSTIQQIIFPEASP